MPFGFGGTRTKAKREDGAKKIGKKYIDSIITRYWFAVVKFEVI